MIPENLMYTKSHEWILVEGQTATMGITQFAQEQLGDLTFIELPEIGREFTAGEEIGSVESVKAAGEIYAPASGQVTEVNITLEASPELVNQDPYGQGWFIRFAITDLPSDLLSAQSYADHVTSEAH
ncbi:MAG: glycine cleavage system protein GcvH [Deltaproteobacteria bacterium]|nr:glycine cleavage system protein GcvH [Deltaproteobacteria bacterium]